MSARCERLAARMLAESGRTAEDANMAYDSKLRKVRQLVRELDKQLLRHEARQGGRMTDWGFVGDLEHAEDELTELLRFIGGGQRT